LIVLSSGSYQSISLTDWIASTPPELLATNFGVPQSTFSSFARGNQVIREKT